MLKIRPIKFQVDSMEMGQLSELNLDLDKRDMSLAIEATKADTQAVDIKFKLRVRLEEEVGLRVTYRVRFEVLNPDETEFSVTDKTLDDKFFKINAPAIGYPFLRAFLGTFCVNAGFKQHLLPAVNFQYLYDIERESAATQAASSPVPLGASN